jgi:uncharacterized protein (DUF2141 family)
MKKIILAISVSSLALLSGTITVEVTKLRNQMGKLSLGLYNKNDKTFAKIPKAYKGVHLKIQGDKVLYRFTKIPNGIYALSIFHDENSNQKLDTNLFGIPTEGYSFSNNIRPKLRGATFEEAKFKLDEKKHISIEMRY